MPVVWRIKGEGLDAPFEVLVPGTLSEREIVSMLQRLASRHLDPEEIVAASLRASSDGYLASLEPQRSQNSITVGDNPFFTASRREMPGKAD